MHPDTKIAKDSPLYKLDVFLDSKNVICVGGRLSQSSYQEHEKHSIVLPKSGYVTKLVLCHFHDKCSHQGKGITLNTIRSYGF